MRIAICSPDMDERYTLSRLVETALLRWGILPEMALFSMPEELSAAAAYQKDGFELAFVAGARDAPALGELCRRIPVILVGGREDGADAFEVGAKYFIEAPASPEMMKKALTRCLGGNKEE